MTREAFTAQEVADMFGVTIRTLYRWIREGRISAFRTLGGHLRIHAAEVERVKAGAR